MESVIQQAIYCRVVIEISEIMVEMKATANWKLWHILILKYFCKTNLNLLLLSVLVGNTCFTLLGFISDDSTFSMSAN